jgi:hypothetical protein
MSPSGFTLGKAPSTNSFTRYPQSFQNAFLHHRHRSFSCHHGKRPAHFQHYSSTEAWQLRQVPLPVRLSRIVSDHLLTPTSNNDKLLALMPPTTADCLKECQVAANKADGCAENDFACHCVNYNTYSDVRLPSQSTNPSPTCHTHRLLPTTLDITTHK